MQGRTFAWNTWGVLLLCFTLRAATAAQDVYRDRQPGSFLVFPAFNISKNLTTQLRITNIDPVTSVQIQLNFVCPGSQKDMFCDALDRHYTLKPTGTAVLDVASQHPPCGQGYVVAFAENEVLGAIRGIGRSARHARNLYHDQLPRSTMYFAR